MSDTNVIDHLTRPERFGTQLRLAEATGCSQGTISDKRKVNRLTHDQMRRILRKAPKMGVAVDAWDFFPELRRAGSDREDAAA